MGGYKTIEAKRAAQNRYYQENRDSMRAKQGGRTYGITPEEYASRRARPCEICGLFDPSTDKRGGGMHVDHDHETNKLRGTLCAKCNRGLGSFDDSPERLSRASEYLRRYKLT